MDDPIQYQTLIYRRHESNVLIYDLTKMSVHLIDWEWLGYRWRRCQLFRAVLRCTGGGTIVKAELFRKETNCLEFASSHQ